MNSAISMNPTVEAAELEMKTEHPCHSLTAAGHIAAMDMIQTLTEKGLKQSAEVKHMQEQIKFLQSIKHTITNEIETSKTDKLNLKNNPELLDKLHHAKEIGSKLEFDFKFQNSTDQVELKPNEYNRVLEQISEMVDHLKTESSRMIQEATTTQKHMDQCLMMAKGISSETARTIKNILESMK